MKIEKTERGFAIAEFTDHCGTSCSIQESSLSEPCIWLGANDIGLKEFKAGEGWKDRKEFDETNEIQHHYVANNRMHLTVDNVRELLPLLQKFVETGGLE